jgi:hypothetical protein
MRRTPRGGKDDPSQSIGHLTAPPDQISSPAGDCVTPNSNTSRDGTKGHSHKVSTSRGPRGGYRRCPDTASAWN